MYVEKLRKMNRALRYTWTGITQKEVVKVRRIIDEVLSENGRKNFSYPLVDVCDKVNNIMHRDIPESLI